jgi:hypothetical protein
LVFVGHLQDGLAKRTPKPRTSSARASFQRRGTCMTSETNTVGRSFHENAPSCSAPILRSFEKALAAENVKTAGGIDRSGPHRWKFGWFLAGLACTRPPLRGFPQPKAQYTPPLNEILWICYAPCIDRIPDFRLPLRRPICPRSKAPPEKCHWPSAPGV